MLVSLVLYFLFSEYVLIIQDNGFHLDDSVHAHGIGPFHPCHPPSLVPHLFQSTSLFTYMAWFFFFQFLHIKESMQYLFESPV